jgi:hypothetical protein
MKTEKTQVQETKVVISNLFFCCREESMNVTLKTQKERKRFIEYYIN